MPKINGNEIRPGNVLEHDAGLWVAVKVDHVKPGKGGAFAQVELKNLRNGSKLNQRFRSADKVERVRLEQKDQQFLYEADGVYNFMDTTSYDQYELNKETVGDAAQYLVDQTDCQVVFFRDKAIAIELPTTVELTVSETPPGYKGDTASGSGKPATLETGIVLTVPMYIDPGDKIKVDTRTGEYVTRV